MRTARVLITATAAAAVLGLLWLNWEAQRRTQQQLNELLARADARPAEPPAPVATALQPRPTETPKAEPPRPSSAHYVIEAPDVLTIEAGLKNPKTNAIQPLPHQSASGQFLVRPDGTVGLGVFGPVAVAGLTLEQATNAVRGHLAKFAELASGGELSVLVSVATYNSKRFYVITDLKGEGESVYAFPMSGNETVLDAVSRVDGLPTLAGRWSVRIARCTNGTEGWENLPVDWAGITVREQTATNYQVLPGDRVYVTRKAD